MLWLFDDTRTPTSALAEHGAIVTRSKLSEHSEWSGEFPESAYDELLAATYAQVEGETTIYLVERVRLSTESGESRVEAGGRSATALLHLRGVLDTQEWLSEKPGAIVSSIVASFSGDRAIDGLTFGDGATLGTAIDIQRSWRDAGEVCMSVLASQGLGIEARLDGADIVLDVFEGGTFAPAIGEAYSNAHASAVERNDPEWRNYAIVLGEDPEPVWGARAAAYLDAGTASSGAASDTATRNGVSWHITESAMNGITVRWSKAVAASDTAGEAVFVGRYTGNDATHWMNVEAYDAVDDVWELLATRWVPGGGVTDGQVLKVPYAERHIDRGSGIALFRVVHNATTYNSSHGIIIDYLGATTQPPRTRIDVDQTGSDALRELIVDARDLQRVVDGVDMGAVAYAALLTERGVEKLAEVQRVRYIEAETSAAVPVGDEVFYDAGAWSATLAAFEVERVYEHGTMTRRVTLGRPRPEVAAVIERKAGPVRVPMRATTTAPTT